MSGGRTRNIYTIHNKVSLIRGGLAYFSAIRSVIDNATQCIHLHIYIFDDDETGREVAAALIRAARRGVRVYVLADGYASQNLGQGFIGELESAGVHFSFFEPFLKSRHFYFGRRLHTKVLVADASVGLVAGINISNRYNDFNGIPAWLDWAIQVEGDAARQLNNTCIKIWNGSVFREKCTLKNIKYLPSPDEICQVRVRVNDWVNRRTQITRTYKSMFRRAESQITIMSSYFWPSAKLLKRLGRTTERGVKVKVILAGISDIVSSKYAERYLYRQLFKNRIEVYEYQDNVLHGKMAVCDNKLVTIGSYNVNNISAYASVELNLDVSDEAFAEHVNEKLEEVIRTSCVQITEPVFSRRYNFLQRLLQGIAYRFIHLIFIMTTFYFRQQKVISRRDRRRQKKQKK